MLRALVSSLVFLPALSGLARAQLDVGSTGQDLAFDAANLDGSSLDADGVVNQAVVVDLAQADTGPGTGTYDATHWRVTFHYTSVVVQQGYSVIFENHPSRAPVVWLSQSDIVIAGTINLNGQTGGTGSSPFFAEPGPGGFRGGLPESAGFSWLSSSGFGPGGGFQNQVRRDSQSSGGGGHASAGGNGTSIFGTFGAGGPSYGDEALTQLIGGSGGAAAILNASSGVGSGGGAGGGAILMAANGTVEVTSSGRILANGGNSTSSSFQAGGAGAGGAIRLVGDGIALQAGATLQALGGPSHNFLGYGAPGRIRLEGNDLTGAVAVTQPPFSDGAPGPVTPPPAAPTVVILSAEGQTLPPDPWASLGAEPDLLLTSGVSQTVVIETTHVALDAAVYLRVTRVPGAASEVLVTDGVTNPLTEVVPGAPDLRARTSTTFSFAAGITALQARVVLPTP